MPVLFSLSSRLSELLSSPPVLRAFGAVLRRHQPVLKIGSQVVVAKHADVTSVLADSDSFGVTEVYAAKFERTVGAFSLGWENTPLYAREASFIRAAILPGDLERVRQLVGQRADESLAAARASGRIDIVNQFGRLIPLELVEKYFGVAAGDRDTMLRWLRINFWDTFMNVTGDRRIVRDALSAGAALRKHVDAAVLEHQRRLAAGSAPDDFVTRLLRLHASDYRDLAADAVKRNIANLLVAAQETQAKAIVHAIEQLLAHPAELARARRAAADGDDELVSRYVFEALRFNPHNPAILRRCHKDTPIGVGTDHATTIPRGATVYAMTISAMFDADMVEDPDSFRVDRANNHYLHFGYGQHQCFGVRLNMTVLPEVIKRVLLLPNLRVSRQTPRIEYEGPFPDRFMLEFDTN